MQNLVSPEHRYLAETITRNPGLIQEGLEIVDHEVPVFDLPPLDMIGIDKDDTLVIIVLRDQIEGERRADIGGNVLEDGMFFWHWVTDYRFDFIDGVSQMCGRQIAMAPPKVFLVAQGFSSKLVDLASYVKTRSDIHLFEIDVDDPMAGATEVEIPKLSATPAARKKYEEFYTDLKDQLIRDNNGFFNDPKAKGYEPVVLSSLVDEVAESDRAYFDEFCEKLQGVEELRMQQRPYRVAFINPLGLDVAEAAIGPGGGVAFGVNKITPTAKDEVELDGQFAAEDVKSAIESALKAAKSFPKAL